jgi:small glutamine-rich tetratricopeptide repeat-containing protein alpha
MSEHKDTIYLIVEYLNGLKESGVSADTIDTVTGLLEAEFDVSSTSAENFGEYSSFPVKLSDIIAAGKKSLGLKKFFESLAEAKEDPKYVSFSDAVIKRGYFDGAEEGSLEHMQRSARLLNKYREKVLNAGPSKTELEAKAEEEKIKGNTAINSKDHVSAINHYTEAIKLSSDGPNSHVYFCNRAAAYCHTNQYQLAVDDCLSSIALSPDYIKAYSRLGLAYYFLEKFQDAVDAYERAVEIEPDNKSLQDSLRQARTKAKKSAAKSSVVPSAEESVPGMPNLGGLMNNPNMKRALDQMGGSAGLSSLMKDPQMMAMAQQMMKDPKMMQQAMSMLGGGGGGDGMPDMSALAGMMGGMGGAPPSSSAAPSSSSGKKQFKGFEE